MRILTPICGLGFGQVVSSFDIDKTNSIIEQIAQWLELAIGQITIDNGYQQTLIVSRPEDVFIAGQSVNDLTTIITQGECKEDGDRTEQEYFWLQTFDIWVYFLASSAAGLSMDTRINRVTADIQKRIGIETAQIIGKKGRLCNDLAYRPGGIPIDLLPTEISVVSEINATVVNVPVAIAFNVDANDPYS